MKYRIKRIAVLFICALVCITGCSKGSSHDPGRSDIVSTAEVTPARVKLICRVPEFEITSEDTTGGKFDVIRPGSPSVRMLGGGTGAYSKPQVPLSVFYLAFPWGASSDNTAVTVTGNGASHRTGLRLYPAQKTIHDIAGSRADDDTFAYDEAVYLNSKTSHTEVKLSKVESIDYANVWQVTVNLMDYDPSEQAGTFYDSLDVKVDFTGETGCYTKKRVPVDRIGTVQQMDKVDEWFEVEAPSANRIRVKNEAVMYDVKYQAALEALVENTGARLIIVTHPNFEASANTLRTHKESLGISTKVVLTTDINARLMSDIHLRDYLINAYNNWLVRPKWVLLMGDVDFIPTHNDSQNNSHDPAPNSGDMFYGQANGNAMELPVFGIGRLPVDTDDQAAVIVNKIIAYETNPPSSDLLTGNPYYYSLTFAAEFQDVDSDHPAPDGRDTRWFVETSENIRNFMLAQHFAVNRIYKASSAHDPLYWEDGSDLPYDLKKPGFAWNGSTADIINAVNQGTSILYHRDHGGYTGWCTPAFETDDLDSIIITDNQYPVVYSINCSSGYFDNESEPLYGAGNNTVSWSEQFIRNPNGAIGIICDTRASSTWLNNFFVKGLFDATWPSYLDYDSSSGSLPIRKLGDILNHAKGYVKSCGFADPDTRQEIIIYNLLGDPTVEVMSSPKASLFIDPPQWVNRSVIDLSFTNPGDLKSRGTPVLAVAMEPRTGTVVGRAIVPAKDLKGANTVSIPIDTAKLGNYNAVEIYLSGSDVLRKSEKANYKVQ